MEFTLKIGDRVKTSQGRTGWVKDIGGPTAGGNEAAVEITENGVTGTKYFKLYKSGKWGARTRNSRTEWILGPAGVEFFEAEAVVDWFSDMKGFGWVMPIQGTVDRIYVHHTAIDVEGFRTLEAGQRVSVRYVANGGAPAPFSAVRVVPLAGFPVGAPR